VLANIAIYSNSERRYCHYAIGDPWTSL